MNDSSTDVDWRRLALARGREIEELQATVANLRDLVAPDITFHPSLKLTGQQERLLRVILSRDLASHETLQLALNEGLKDLADEWGQVLVVLHYCRRKLAPHGIEIKTLWGRGYFMEAADKARLRAFLIGSDVEK